MRGHPCLAIKRGIASRADIARVAVEQVRHDRLEAMAGEVVSQELSLLCKLSN